LERGHKAIYYPLERKKTTPPSGGKKKDGGRGWLTNRKKKQLFSQAGKKSRGMRRMQKPFRGREEKGKKASSLPALLGVRKKGERRPKGEKPRKRDMSSVQSPCGDKRVAISQIEKDRLLILKGCRKGGGKGKPFLRRLEERKCFLVWWGGKGEGDFGFGGSKGKKELNNSYSKERHYQINLF